MPDTPRIHWPRFKLSTILVLVGLLAWLFSTRPWLVAAPVGYAYAIGFNPSTMWPLFALAAFLTWKIGRAIAARRKPTPTSASLLATPPTTEEHSQQGARRSAKHHADEHTIR